MKRLLLIIVTLLGMGIDVRAQQGLAVETAFSELSLKQNATEVVMGAGRLKKFRLSLFHSLEIKKPTEAELLQVEASVEKDAMQATLRKESAGHRLYELPESRGLHRYIFYRRTPDLLILIYIEGKASMKQIESQFLKKQH